MPQLPHLPSQSRNLLIPSVHARFERPDELVPAYEQLQLAHALVWAFPACFGWSARGESAREQRLDGVSEDDASRRGGGVAVVGSVGGGSCDARGTTTWPPTRNVVIVITNAVLVAPGRGPLAAGGAC